MQKPIHALPFCVPALLAAQLFSAAFEVQAACPGVTGNTVNVTTATIGPNGATSNLGGISTCPTGTDGQLPSNVNLTITTSGSITIASTSTGNGVNVNPNAINNTIINNGAITIQNTNAAGIRAANSGEITNNLTITVTGSNSEGIVAGNGNTITNNLTINGTGSGSRGIVAGDGNTIINNDNGSITTASRGIEAGSNNTITNRGDITATSSTDGAIYISGTGNSLTNTGNIAATIGRGVGGADGASFSSLTNRVSDTRKGASVTTGQITGSTDGIRVGFIANLINEAGAVIEGEGGAGVALTRTTAGMATVTNSGRIQGATYGLDYGAHTISQLTNNNGGLIQGGSGAGVKAAAIGTLTNNTGGRIISTGSTANSHGIRSEGAITRLTNHGTITGGQDGISSGGAITTLTNHGTITAVRHGVKADSIGTLTNSATGTITATGTSGDGVNSTGAISTLTNHGTISGGRHGVSALTVNLNNSSNITGGTSGMATDTDRHALKLGTGNSTIVNTGKITSTKGRGISGEATTVITTLTNRTGTASDSGTISGSTDGIAVGRIGSLTNSGTIRGNGGAGIILNGGTVAGNVTTTVTNSGMIQGSTDGLNYGNNVITSLGNSGTIRGDGGAGITLSGTTTSRIEITNSGTIKGTTYGLNYGTNTIAKLENRDRGKITGGSQAAIRAGNITELTNDANAEISSRDGAGVSLSGTGGSGTVTNSGTIKGGTYGLNYGTNTITKLENRGRGKITGGSEAAVRAGNIAELENDANAEISSRDKAGVTLSGTGGSGTVTNSGTIKGGTFGLDYGTTNTITKLENRGRGKITGGSEAAVRAGNIAELENDANAEISSRDKAGVTLSGTGGSGTVTNSGTIKGGTYGLDYGTNTITKLENRGRGKITGGLEAAVAAGNIEALENDTNAEISSTNGAGVSLSGTGGSGTVTNSGTIKGGTFGLDYGGNTITSLKNRGSGEITGGSEAAVAAGNIEALENEANAEISSTNGAGVTLSGTGGSGTVTNSGTIKGGTFGLNYGGNTITSLKNRGSGEITGGSEAAVAAGNIEALENEANAEISSRDGAGVTLSGSGGSGTVTNSGTIKGGTYGLDYLANTITKLENRVRGKIEGGSQAAVRAGDIDELTNEVRATISSASGDGVSSSGAIGTLTNSGTISGGRYGVSAASVGLTNSGDITSTVGAGATGAALNLTGTGSTITNTGKLTSTNGRGISGSATSAITTLTNRVNPLKPFTSGKIEGGTDGINVGFIESLTNNTRAVIRGTSGAGVTLSGAAGSATATVTNSGTIQGGTDGLNYGAHTLRQLTNNRTGLIQGGSGAAVSAGAITRLDNQAGGRVISTGGDGVSSAGAIGTLNNDSEISGGRHGVSAGSVGALTNRKTIRGGASGSGLNASGEVSTLNNERDAEISGGRDGIRAGSLLALTNQGRITSATGGGITLTGRNAKHATVINHGTIQGATHGMDYGQNTIASLLNTSSESIRGGTGDALRAAAMRHMNNSGTIFSAGAGGITLTGTASGASYTNSALIEGKTHGLDYGNNAIARLDNTPTGILRSADGPALKGRAALHLHNRGRVEGRTGIFLERPTTGAGRHATIDNYGILRSRQGGAGTAVELKGLGRDTLRYQAGSRLEGLISWDGAGDTFFYAPSTPAIFSFRDNNTAANGAPDLFNVIAPAQQTILRSTSRSPRPGEGRVTVAFLDASLYALTDSTFSRWTGAVSEALAQQVRSEYSNGDGQVLWLRPFAGYQDFSADGPRPSARHDYMGGLAGFSMQSGMARFGLFGGAAEGKTSVSGAARDQENDSFFAGAYLHGPVRGVHLHGALLAGQSHFQSGPWTQINNLAPAGRERVSVDYKSLFLSSQIGLLGGRLDLFGLGLHPAVQLRYLGRFTEDHAYQPDRAGAPALLSIKRHDVHIGLLRAELRAPASLWKGRHSRLRGEMRLGAEGAMTLGGRKIPVLLGGGETAFKARGKRGAATGFIGAGLRYSVPSLNLTFSADIEGSYDTDAATSVWGQIGYEWEF